MQKERIREKDGKNGKEGKECVIAYISVAKKFFFFRLNEHKFFKYYICALPKK